MKNKKRFTLSVIFLFGMMITTYGQKVYRDGNGKFFFEAEGMPAESYSRTAKPTNLPNIATKENNHTIAYKFEIAGSDVDTNKLSWRDAINRCHSQGNGWRLPTFRELTLMHIFFRKLQDLPGFDPFVKSNDDSVRAEYWGATESLRNFAFYILFSNNRPEVGSASTITDIDVTQATFYVRCVRDQ